MKTLLIITLSILAVGCASNKVTVTDSGIDKRSGEAAKCAVMVGDEMSDKDFCLTYESNSCQVRVGSCVITSE